MSATELLAPTTTRQAVEAKGRSAPRAVTGKLKRAIDAMVWEGSRRDDAAAAAGMAVHGLREALRKPHVKAYYLQQLEVLRTSERARNVLRLAEIRDAGNNMPAVQAIGMLERMEAESTTRSNGSVQLPGLTIQIINAHAPETAQAPTITATYTKSSEDDDAQL